MITIKKISGLLIVTVWLSGCAAVGSLYERRAAPPEELIVLETLTQDGWDELEDEEERGLRFDMLRETGLSIGARQALAWRAKQINVMLDEQAAELAQIFNFNAVMLPDNVIPPVLIENLGAVNMESPYVIRIADRNYRIIKQASFVTVAPTWEE